MKKRYTTIFFVLILVWVGLILYFSSQVPEVSHGQSGWAVQFFYKLNDWLDISDNILYEKISYFIRQILLDGRYETPNAIMRKSAHFGIYMVLGMISCLFSYIHGGRYILAIMIGVSFPVLVAVLDEYNQKFTGRTSSLTDVILDGAGALVGTCLALVLIFIGILITKLKAKYNYTKRNKK